MDRGWVSAPICFTNDGYPTTAQEDCEYEDGHDPCLFACRVYGDDDAMRRDVEDNFAPAVWRKL